MKQLIIVAFDRALNGDNCAADGIKPGSNRSAKTASRETGAGRRQVIWVK